MTEWTIVLVISALVGLFLTVGKPILNLNQAITKLQISVDNLQEYQKTQDSRLTAHSQKLDNHENRIIKLEIHDGLRKQEQ